MKSGVVADILGATCWLKLAVGGKSPGDAVDAAAVLTPSFVPAAGDEPAHYLFTAAPEQGIALAVGRYIADARIQLNGAAVEQTESVFVDVVERVTEEA